MGAENPSGSPPFKIIDSRGDATPFVFKEKFLMLNSNGTLPGLKTWLLKGVLSSKIASGKKDRESTGEKVTGSGATSDKAASPSLTAGDSLVSLEPEEQEMNHKLTISREIWILFMESHQLRLKIFIFEEFNDSTT
jgi:hypothetical protein